MREYEFDLKGITKGLRPRGHAEQGESGLTECFNLMADETELTPIEMMQFPTGLSYSWPFPQMFITDNYEIAMTSDTLYTLDSNLEASQSLSITVGTPGSWHLADFGDYVVLTNGTEMIHYDIATSAWAQLTVSATVPIFGTCCNFNGQAVVANIGAPGGGSGYLLGDGNTIMWSKIGSFDFTHDKTNVAGHRQAEWSGEVYKVLPLGKGVVVYGSSGIGYLYPSGTTFGFKKLADYGIADRDAAAGTVEGQVFLDEAGYLRRIAPDLKIQLLHFQEFLEDLVYSTPVVSYVPVDDIYYISTASKCYMLNEHGLSEGGQFISSVYRTNGGLYGTGAKGGDSTYDEARLTTDDFDMGDRSLKTIQLVEGRVWEGDKCSVQIAWRTSNTGNFANVGGWRVFNPQDVVTYPMSGIDFRVSLKFTDHINVHVNRLKVRFKHTDRRSIRGRMRVN